MSGSIRFFEHDGFAPLLDALRRRGFLVVGPTVRGGAIVYEELKGVEDLPVGWTDEQGGGTYRLRKRDDEALFGFVVGPQSWKKYLFPPSQRLWQAHRGSDGGEIEIVEEPDDRPAYAFIGVRACELEAIAVQDRVFCEGPYVDPRYRSARERAFLVAVNCVEARGTCFCASMNTGPRATSGFDIALTEVMASGAHGFVVEVGSPRGEEVLQEIPHRDASEQETEAARGGVERAVREMGRRMETDGLKELLYASYEHPRWEEVAKRCLSCGNCTLVCPTCFCSSVEDVTDLTGETAERLQRWDSCFSVEYAYVHGGSTRTTTRACYRQWMTHKLATWIDQFGTSGCVGCGRCITWCPVGIDITEEVRVIRESPAVPSDRDAAA